MKDFNPNKWKEKIDPDFDITVKTVLGIVRDIKDSADNKYLVVRDEVLQPILNGQGWQNLYDGKEWKRFNDGMNEAIKEGVNEGLKPESLRDERLPRKQKAMKRWLISKTKGLSESSQKYYVNGITSFFNGTLLKASWRLPETKRQKAIEYNQRELGAFFLALFCRLQIQELKEFLDSDNDDGGALNDPEMLNSVLSLIFSMIAQISFQNTMFGLLKNKDDDESILKAVTIDKAVVCTDVLRQRILKAELSGDSAFLKKLGRAISKGSVNKEAIHYETYMVLRIFWGIGLNKLKLEELYYFLKSCGVHPPRYPYAFERFLIRHIYPLHRRHDGLALP
jgi:hypothetical protein